MRCLIIGGDGMLGHQLLAAWSDRHDVRVTLRRPLSEYERHGLFTPQNSIDGIDVVHPDRLAQVFTQFKPEAVVNAAGVIKQRKSTVDAHQMLQINSVFPRQLLKLCHEHSTRLVHVSTDCVFNGNRGNYFEQDSADAEDVYGLSKYLGELAEAPAITLRTSIIGLELARNASLIEWFLAQRGTIKGFSRAIYSGLTTIEMARVIELVMDQHRTLNGVWHVASEPITKFDLLSRLAREMGRTDITIERDESFHCDRSLNGRAFAERTGYRTPRWDAMIAELVEQIRRRTARQTRSMAGPIESAAADTATLASERATPVAAQQAKRLKVLAFVGTRPEIIKLSRVIAELDRHTDFVLVHSGQNYDYELNEVFFEDLKIRRPDVFLEAAGGTAAETMGLVLSRGDRVLQEQKPDAVLIYGDTNTGLAAIVAKRRQIPIFHMEAGNRCFDQRVPEETNRKIIDHISDINLPLTEHARRYLLDEGIRPETVIKSGSTMKEVLDYYRPGIEQSDVLKRLELEPRKYFVVSTHREENVDSPRNLQELLTTLNVLAETYHQPVIVSLHPRTRKRLEGFDAGTKNIHPLVRFSKPFGFFDYVALQSSAFCVLSDSGTITEESSLLGFPAVTIREAHERPEGMDVGTLVMCGLRHERVLQAVEVVTSQCEGGVMPVYPVDDYDGGPVSKKVIRIILSYVDYVNRTVWSK